MKTKGSQGAIGQLMLWGRYSHSRHREEQVQVGSGPGMFKELKGEQQTNEE